MSRRLEYYFSMVSPWAFIGHDLFMKIVARHKIAIAYHPVALPEVFENTGGLPLAKRHPARTAYRFLELQRWREKRGLDFVLQPEFWPFDVNQADRVVIALFNAGENPESFIRAGFAASWAEGRNMAEAVVLADVLDANGYDSASTAAAAKSKSVSDAYERNTRKAIENGYFGSPVYVLNGECFWGQDRLELLEDALQSGRAPYQVPAVSIGFGL